MRTVHVLYKATLWMQPCSRGNHSSMWRDVSTAVPSEFELRPFIQSYVFYKGIKVECALCILTLRKCWWRYANEPWKFLRFVNCRGLCTFPQLRYLYHFSHWGWCLLRTSQALSSLTHQFASSWTTKTSLCPLLSAASALGHMIRRPEAIPRHYLM